MTLTRKVAALTALGALMVGSMGASPSMAAKKAAPAKMKATSFICQHGCKKKITVKTAADWSKKCPVCKCGTMTKMCKPADKK